MPVARREIEAAIAAYNDDRPGCTAAALTLPACLAVMFRRSSVCQRSLADLAAEGFETKRLVQRLLRHLARGRVPVEGAEVGPWP